MTVKELKVAYTEQTKTVAMIFSIKESHGSGQKNVLGKNVEDAMKAAARSAAKRPRCWSFTRLRNDHD